MFQFHTDILKTIRSVCRMFSFYLFFRHQIQKTGPAPVRCCLYVCLLLARSHIIKHNDDNLVHPTATQAVGDLWGAVTSYNIGRDFGDVQRVGLASESLVCCIGDEL